MRNLLALLLFLPSLCPAQLPDYVAVEDLIAWYSFNGNADDSGPGSHNGTLHNTSFTYDRFGELNGALEFNGTNSYVSVAHDVNLNLSGSEFTLSVWVNHQEFDEWDQNLIVKSDGPGSAPSKWLFWHKANVNAPSGLGFASNQTMLGGVEQVSTSSWHHYLVAKHSDRIEFYLDGQLESTEFVEFQNDPTTAELRIGGEEPGGGNQWFDGAMDDVGIWNRALSESEIQSLFSSVEVGLPDYVPTDGLVAWYPLAEDGTDASPSALHATPIDVSFTSDSIQGDVALMNVSGNHILCPDEGDFDFTESFSIVGDFLVQSGFPTIPSNLHMILWNKNNSYELGLSGSLEITYAMKNAPDNWTWIGTDIVLTTDTWYHIGFTWDGNTVSVAVDGEVQFEDNRYGNLGAASSPLRIGHREPNTLDFSFYGRMADIGIYDRALTDFEMGSLAYGLPLSFGCTDPTACNFDAEANANDGFCEYGCLYCGEGTYWVSTLQECIAVIPPADSILVPIPSCGAGTVWDPINEECIIAVPTDNDFDGCVTPSDLLNLLATFGTCPPIPEWPNEPADTTWTCGDPVTYWDYDYATVLIGDQCWFAENLRAELYSNGDSIKNSTLGDNWLETGNAGVGICGIYGDNTCQPSGSQAPFAACDSALSLDHLGRIYNYFSCIDNRDLCPYGWSVSTDENWLELEEFVGMPPTQLEIFGLRGDSLGIGDKLKDTWSWCCLGAGSDEVGLGVLAGGRKYYNGLSWNAGRFGFFWTPSNISDIPTTRSFDPTNNGIGRGQTDFYGGRFGYSVRCIKD